MTIDSGHASSGGHALAWIESAAENVSIANAAFIQREGRHSILATGASTAWGKLDDPFDEGGKFGIGDGFVAHEPAPELIVLAVEQA